ncbi:MAG: hypothetical protein WC867_01445 [Candidatus Pacearchaeota archaeon]|jgi:hypothetical protein
MKIKVKKLHSGRIVRIETGGEIKEVMIHSDLFDTQRGKISICFKGQKNSGIVELTEKEANDLYKTLAKKIGLIKEIKIIKD